MRGLVDVARLAFANRLIYVSNNTTHCVTNGHSLPAPLARPSSSDIAMIQLIGPGGAGKSTVGRLIAEHLACPFLDLDRLFETTHGDIDRFLQEAGYETYARVNVDTYCAIDLGQTGVLAMSSGFMTYPDHHHPALRTLRCAIASSPSTVVLLPSFDLEICAAEIVRRQQGRGFPRRRSDAREMEVIRERFPIYRALPVVQIETMQSPSAVAVAVVKALRRRGALDDPTVRAQLALRNP